MVVEIESKDVFPIRKGREYVSGGVFKDVNVCFLKNSLLKRIQERKN